MVYQRIYSDQRLWKVFDMLDLSSMFVLLPKDETRDVNLQFA
jgi:hypothetical protein